MVAAREIGRRDNANPKYASGSTFAESTGPHAHNVYLQVWFDTGLVGVALMLGIGLFALRAIALEAATNQPSLYAAFASNTLLASSSFSIWARWFLASFALSTIFAVLASKFATNMREAGPDRRPFRAWHWRERRRLRQGAGNDRVSAAASDREAAQGRPQTAEAPQGPDQGARTSSLAPS
jgi:O-antigen ligase